jgi:hypothetical protein
MQKATLAADQKLGEKGNKEAKMSAAKLRATAREIFIAKGVKGVMPGTETLWADAAITNYTNPEDVKKWKPDAFKGKSGRKLLIALETLKEVERDINYYENDPEKKLVSDGLLKTYLGSGNQKRNTLLKAEGHDAVTDRDYLKFQKTKVDKKDLEDLNKFKIIPKKYKEVLTGPIKSFEEIPEHKVLEKGMDQSFSSMQNQLGNSSALVSNLENIGMRASGFLKPTSAQEENLGRNITQAPVEIVSNVNILVNGKAILKQKDLANQSRIRDYFANISRV